MAPRFESWQGHLAEARRVRAAQLLAGDPPLRQIARDAGLDYGHLTGVINGVEPLTSTDVVDLGRVLGVPPRWLARGWGDQSVSCEGATDRVHDT